MVMVMVVMVMMMMMVPEGQRKHDARTMVVVMVMVVMVVMVRDLNVARIGRRILLLVDRLQHRAGVRDRLQQIGIGMGL
jgi:hypothetical protein